MKISEILERLYWSSSDSNGEWEYKEFVYEALDEIAEIVLEQKKSWHNKAITDIAKLFTGKEQTK